MPTKKPTRKTPRAKSTRTTHAAMPALQPPRDEVLPKVYLGFAAALVVFLWITALVLYPSLPDTLATHFSVTGSPDSYAQKSFFVVFFIPILQSVLTALFFFLYANPQYMHIPSSMLVHLLPEPYRAHIFAVFRKTISAVGVLVNILFTYIGLAILASATGEAFLNPWIVFGLVALLIAVAIVSSLSSWHIVHEAIHRHHFVEKK